MQFQWCGSVAATRIDGRPVPLPRKAMALLAYLCLEPGPHSRSHLSALLWPESDDVHAAMSLRQALSKLRELLGDALIADRQQVSLQRQEMPLAEMCDVHRFESLLVSDPLTACRTDVHRFLDALAVDDAPDFVHWCDRTRARLSRSAIAGLQRAAEESRARRDWSQLRDVSERWLAIDPLSADAACHAIEAAFLMHDAAGALARRDQVVQTLTREELADDATLARIRALVTRYERLAHPTPAGGVRAVTAAETVERPRGDAPTPWYALALREREHAWRLVMDAFERVQHDSLSQWVTLTGGVGSGRSRLLRDAMTLFVERGATVMTMTAHVGGVAYSAIAALLRSVMHEDALAGLDERTLRTLSVLVPELADVYPMLRRSGAGVADRDITFAVQLQEALVQLCTACTEERVLVIGLDEAMAYDRESIVTLQALATRVAGLPVLWLATDADDEVQTRENGEWVSVVRRGLRVDLPPLSAASVTRMLTDASGVSVGWEALAARVYASAHGMPGPVVEVLQRLETAWGTVSAGWQDHPLDTVPVPGIGPRLRAHVDGLDAVGRTILLSLAVVMEAGHPVPPEAWAERPVLTPDDLSHIHGISRLRAAVLGAELVECRLAREEGGGFRCASPAVVAHVLAESSGLVRDELRRLVRTRQLGTKDG